MKDSATEDNTRTRAAGLISWAVRSSLVTQLSQYSTCSTDARTQEELFP